MHPAVQEGGYMRRLSLVFALVSMTGAVYGQNALPSAVSTPSTNSVIDQNGNLMIFDVSYSYPTAANRSTAVFFPPVVTTRVTVITVTAGATAKTSFDYPGALQVAGVGRYAVYAIDTEYMYTSTTSPAAVPG